MVDITMQWAIWHVTRWAGAGRGEINAVGWGDTGWDGVQCNRIGDMEQVRNPFVGAQQADPIAIAIAQGMQQASPIAIAIAQEMQQADHIAIAIA